MKLVECVPNFSEGRRPEIVAQIRDAIAAVEGVAVLDVSSDQSHNRTVVTFVAPVEHAVDAAFAGIQGARAHRPESPHRRTPAHGRNRRRALHSARRRDDGRLHRPRAHTRRARRTRAEIPVFLYERAATTPDARKSRRRPPRRVRGHSRRDERRRRESQTRLRSVADPRHRRRRRDRRAAVPRRVQRLPRTSLESRSVAKNVAKAVRGSSGGLRYVKGLGLEVDGQAQVSMNLVDTEKTPLYRAYDMVKMEARGAGRVADMERDRRARAGTSAVRHGRATHPAARFQAGNGAREQSPRRPIQGGESLTGFVGGGGVADRRRPAAEASPRLRARSARRSRRWSQVSRRSKEIRRRRRRDA